MESETPGDSYIVGIGASAGGLEALEKFFGSMSSDSGLAFVVIQHLSPDYKSLMAEILSKRATMPVYNAEDGQHVETNCIYLIPPKKNITIFHRQLFLTDRNVDYLHLPIDIFLNSLAEDVGEKAIAIILSGTGSDGTRGLRAIKEAGGMVMVQDSSTAKFDGMPRSAIATKLVDYILPPERMPQELINYVQFPLRSMRYRDDVDVLAGTEDNLIKLFGLLRGETGVDFTFYKPNTMIRRIERRMSIHQIDSLTDYLHYLYQYPTELRTLYKELLIGVTRFFRDPEGFETLYAEALPAIFGHKQANEQIRIWVPACSTGEEAYSLAIICHEYMEEAGDIRDVKVFATDLDREALDYGGRGQYPESTIADIALPRLQKYFVKRGDSYEIARQVREMVIFAQQDVTKDPPFSKIDLISCRNLLIYLQPVLQRKVLTVFQFALNSGGFLFLGNSETVGDMEDAFRLVSHRWKVYQYRGGVRPPLSASLLLPTISSGQAKGTAANLLKVEAPLYRDELRTAEKTYRNLLELLLPPMVLIDERFNLVHTFGAVDQFLQVPGGGRFTSNIFKMVREPLSIPLNTAVSKAMKDREEVVYHNVVAREGQTQIAINLIVRPFEEPITRQFLILIQFESLTTGTSPTQNTTTYDVDRNINQRIADLEQELQYNRENLQATIEELETANEELQATNEELLAANEELQSTNEELQSVNEELITVNSEYQVKIKELTDLNADLNNLISSTDVGIIFLDRQLHIRKFTPPIQQEINLLTQDLGRPLRHITHRLRDCNLVDMAQQVLRRLIVIEQERQSENGNWYLLKVLPYLNLDKIPSGVIISLVDITDIKKLQRFNEDFLALSVENHELKDVQAFLSAILDALPDHIAILDEKGAILYVNEAWRQFGRENGLTWKHFGVGINYLDICAAATGNGAAEAHSIANGIRDLIAGQRSRFNIEYPCHDNHNKRWFNARITAFHTSQNQARIVVAHENITQIRALEHLSQRFPNSVNREP